MTDITRSQWLAERRNSIGASDVAAADTGRYGGAAKAVASKFDLGIVVDEIDPELADRGHRWEQPVADGVLAHYGLYIHAEQTLIRAPGHPRHHATIEGMLSPLDRGSLGDMVANFECKTRAPFSPWPWDYYRSQCQFGMHCTGLARCLLAVATVDTDWDPNTGQISEQLVSVHYQWIDRDDYEIERLAALADWLWDHVERGVLPDPTGPESLPYVKAFNAYANPDATADLDDLAELIGRREQLLAAAKAAHDEQLTIEAKIRARMGGATEVVAAGRWRVRCGNPVRKFTTESEIDFLELYGTEAAELGVTRTVTQFDRQRAKEVMPDQYDTLRKITPHRVLTVKDLRPEEKTE
jgi:hypothetical protein